MKYTRLIPAIVLTLVAVSACKKKDNDSSSAKTKMMYGTWKEKYDIKDSNGNNIMDSDEYTLVDDSRGSTLAFAKDGKCTGTCSDGSCDPVTFEWALTDGESKLKLINTSMVNPDTGYLRIISITADKLTFSIGISDTAWTVFEKQ